MAKLFCAIVGVAGSAFSVRVDESDTVDDLKDAIKAKKPNDFKDIDADKLQLFLAKKDEGRGAWLTEADVKKGVKDTTGLKLLDKARARLRRVGLSDKDVGGVDEEEEAEGRGPVNVLVEVPEGGKRNRSDEWFGETSHPMKKRRVDAGVDEERRFFDMRDFPPLLAHPKVEFKTIVERKAYLVIFAQLMDYAKSCFEYKSKPGKDSNVIVTGNPGTGKSRFFLYCIFQLVRRERDDVKQLPPYELVLNYGSTFYKYDATKDEFVELDGESVELLRTQPRVLRLVEAASTHLSGWKGVSVLFASPGAEGVNDFEKVDGLTYIMPTWTLEELAEYNSLLPDDLKLAEDVLVSRFDTFGGVPRFIFAQARGETMAKLHKAIKSFSALKIISYCKENAAVMENNYSHCVLQMIPTQDNYRANFHLDFLSMHVADAIIDKVHGESLARVSEFAILHDADDSGSTAVIRGKMYELLCHKWLSLQKERTLHFRSLCSTTMGDLTIPKEMQTVRFAVLDKVKLAKSWTYYRPTSKTFGALDAFIWDGSSKCYGLQMTLNENHGINAAPLNKFLEWLQKAGVSADHFYFTFLVPSNIATSYKKQSARTATGAVSKAPGAAAGVNQFVAVLDVTGRDE
ncbi:hypothetical protein PHYSODRAFT_553734 [Phytophthora sojae]|uniref:Crinkler effector protein N-terminal domain-containing protein n=1 Tax=Phytophthora sojae (strain P6497) TaxID=1094619 RepID=G4YGQ1_PHYSP|nr:hypothetical protein PHYSODRAFT_553734 [Phytophthora sojae]EGZ27014.1 hypothetical protein PHYSODRAFT_553734 [Phytophthora sojae]|eukprot:XP_009514289.1 hypothetical protein PHYSODRAFT_553734 [Phytophthora sojae]